jgi:flagellin-like protein
MKGITPVISIILLIMITISLVSFLFIWFSGFMPTLLNQTEAQLTEQQRQMQMDVRFINVYEDNDNIKITVRNSGKVEIRPNELLIVAKSGEVTIGTTQYPYAIPAGDTLIDWDTGISCPAGETEVKADILGPNDDVVMITCT